tara:strand:- start:148 stop:552 length:405 start_codon:yes stop_codon:yes gene_type:complete
MATFNESGSGGILIAALHASHRSYVGSGNIELINCAIVTQANFFVSLFGPGDIAFSAFAAKKGILEKVCIKTVARNCFSRSGAVAGAGCFSVYRDKYNSIWLDEDLMLQVEATTVAQAYLDTFIAHELELLRNC